jgi:speckle-type POZ protein
VEFEHTDFISVFLKLDATVAMGEAVKAKFQFSLLDQHRKLVPPYTRTSVTREFSAGTCWGFENFIKREQLEKSEHREQLEKSEHLKDDSFTVKVDITVMSEFHAQKTPSIAVPPSDMHRHFGDLLSSKAGVDVEF